MSILPKNIHKISLATALDLLNISGYPPLKMKNEIKTKVLMDNKNDINRNNKYSLDNHLESNMGVVLFVANNEGGMLKLPERTPKIMQERHNGGHILHYLSLLSYSILNDVRSSLSNKSGLRIKAHLECLREFISDEDKNLNWAIEKLLKALDKNLPARKSEWVHFIIEQNNAISVLAWKYAQDKKIFEAGDIKKMRDLNENKFWLRVWWWKLKVTKVIRKNSWLKQVKSLLNVRKAG